LKYEKNYNIKLSNRRNLLKINLGLNNTRICIFSVCESSLGLSHLTLTYFKKQNGETVSLSCFMYAILFNSCHPVIRYEIWQWWSLDVKD